MAAEIINLNRAQKARKAAGGKGRKSVNRAKFGQTKAARESQKKATARAASELSGKRLNDKSKTD